MLLKILGSLLVISASSFLGYIYSRDCSKRPQDLRDLQGMLHIFENEISFMSNLLIDAFEKVYKSSSSEAACIFEAAFHNLRKDDGLSAFHAWEKAVKENIKKTALNEEDEKILVSFGQMLGNSDLDGQINNIRLTINHLKLQEQKAEESRKKYETMYMTLGMLGGITIVIVLL